MNNNFPLRSRQELIVVAFQRSPAPTAITWLETGEIILVNEACSELFGYAREELEGARVLELGIWLIPEARDDFVRQLRHSHHVTGMNASFRRKNGEVFHAIINASALEMDGKAIALVSLSDISLHHRDRELLLRKDKMLALAERSSRKFLEGQSWHKTLQSVVDDLGKTCEQDRAYLFEFHKDAEGRIDSFSQRFEWCAEGIMPTINDKTLQHGDAGLISRWIDLFQQGISVKGAVSEFPEKERTVLQMQEIVSLIVVPVFCDDQLWGFLGMDNCHEDFPWTNDEHTILKSLASAIGAFIKSRKITDHLRVLNSAIEQIPDTIIITDASGTILYFNSAFERVTGYSCSDIIGKTPRILKSGVHSEDFYKKMWTTLLKGETWSGRITNKRKDGSLYEELATISPVYDDEGHISHFVAVKHDMTWEMEKELQLQQAQKMEAIGRLAGGIAHDFNNMLAIIQLNAELARDLAANDKDLLPMLEQILDSTKRSARLTQQLLSFARQQKHDPKPTDLNKAVQDTLKMLRRLIGENITLEFCPHDDLWMVFMDSVQVDQILANLVINARDAIQGSGKITISLANCHLPMPGAPLPENAADDCFVCLQVKDTGCGMDRETMQHIFEPFFTTKETGKGTGLGLSTVYGIVKDCGGTIRVESAPGQGSSFDIFLPRHRGSQSEKDDSPNQIPKGANETILIVEDEPAIRQAVATTLSRLGYNVFTAANAAEAQGLIESTITDMDLLLCDIVMPGISGPEFAMRTKEKHPSLRCLFMSGYASDPLNHEAMIKSLGGNLIRKPFSSEQIARKISEILQAPGEPARSAVD